MKPEELTAAIMATINSTIEIPQDKVLELQAKMADLVQNIFEKLKEQDHRITQAETRINRLEKCLKSVVNRERRSQVDLVRNTVIIRSTKPKTDIVKFIIEALNQGGGDKLKASQVSLIDVASKDGTPAIYKVMLKENNKVALFKGLSTTRDSDIRVDNEVPLFLLPVKRNLARISYTLRKKHPGLRAKIGYKSLKLRILVKAPGKTDWITMDDTAASGYLDEQVFYRRDEAPASIPSVREFLTATYKSLEIC